MTETGSTVERLKRLHAAPKNTFSGNLRSVSQAQLDEYYAMHDAFRALLAVVEAAQALTDHGAPAPNNARLTGQSGMDWYVSNLRRKLKALHSQASDEPTSTFAPQTSNGVEPHVEQPVTGQGDRAAEPDRPTTSEPDGTG